ncbi:MAG: metallophosphoesterase [Candidatus Latescibacterota bacterium]
MLEQDTATVNLTVPKLLKVAIIIFFIFLIVLGCVCTSNQKLVEQPSSHNNDKYLFSFVHLTDIHISNSDWNQHWHWGFKLFPGLFEKWKKNYFKIANDINQLKPSFVFLTGDLVMGGAEGGGKNEFLAVKDSLLKLKVPLYVIPGDHDLGISAFASSVATKEALERYESIFGISYFSFDYDSAHFIGLNSSLSDDGLENEKQKQIEWLKNDLEKSRGKRVFLFAHRESILKEIYPIVKDYDVRALFGGHIHKNSENDYNGIKVITTTSTSYTMEDPGYRIIHIYENGFRCEAKLLSSATNNSSFNNQDK